MTTKEIPVLVKNDPWLEPYTQQIQDRIDRYRKKLEEIKKSHGSLASFSSSYNYFGFNYDNEKKGWWYREWAPNAQALYLTGDFNDWDRTSTPLNSINDGVWELFLEDKKYGNRLSQETALKVHVVSEKNALDRIPAYARYVVQDEETKDFTARLYKEERPFKWTDKKFSAAKAYEAPSIYECHVGMAQETEGVGSYRDFADEVLPRIKELGYNTIQLMAIQEHPYYGSFGYHVSSFFASSSRFGRPEDLKHLINEAHKMDIAVIIDIVHSHAVKNIAEGLNEFDGSDHQYFHAGSKGNHNTWDSKLFNYGKPEVLQFLLSNVKYWIEEFHVDGYRYDGVTSMLYEHHGDFMSFDHYDKYFVNDIDRDVLVYLQLANTLIKEMHPNALVIAEDMSGMPGLCRPVSEGGIGFDFRLGMGIPDFWIKYLKEKKDEEWDIYELYHTLTNRRHGERTIAYTESHDQAIVGDKTIAFWLMDKEMYDHMQVSDENHIIDRGIALHKMLRMFTLSLGGEGYLNFIGNEFGHPEWLDFPREGNDWSYKYARRQWSLVDNKKLKYHFLNDFDRDMIHLANQNNLLSSLPAQQLNMDGNNKVIIFERNNLIFLFNFHWDHSIADYRFKIPDSGKFKIILNSDSGNYGGFGRVDDIMTYPSVCLFGEHFLSIYLPSRTCLVLKNISK